MIFQILHLLYDKDILQEDSILNWASEKEEADDADKFFVKQAAKFIQVGKCFAVYVMACQNVLTAI